MTRSRRVAVPLAVLALAGTGVAAYGARSDDGVRYRTVAATRGDVTEELTLAGTLAPSGTADLAFGTDGSVARVRVEQGDEVRQGQVLAVLDRASLRAEVDRARSDLADARAQLAADRDAQATAVDTATSTPPGSTGGATADGPGSAAPGSDVLARLSAQQDDVVAAQTAASTALATAADRLADQQQACAEPTEPESAEPSAPEDDTTPAAVTGAVLSEACTSALAAVQAAQADAAGAQTTLQDALQALGTTLTGTLGSLSATTPTQAPTQTPTQTPTATPTSTPDAPASTPTVTAATLAQDQATIDRSLASLAAARAALRGAVVRAPADGTVVSLAVGVDDQVASGDTVATLVAPGSTTATVEVFAEQAARLATGTPAEVTPAGAVEALAGTVGRVEHTASDSSGDGGSGDPTYAVEVVLDERDLALADGLPATVAVEVGAAQDVVLVPASALSDGTVRVLDDTGTARRIPVTTGVVGATEVEITGGLDVGDRVVLADLDADLPTGGSGQQGPGGGFGGFGGEGVRMGPPGGSIAIRP